MPADSTDVVAAVHRLRHEIDQLTQEQAEALKSATYLGMTAEQAQRHDERRKNITRFVQQLALLEKAQ
jgi:hypothetical protein